MRVQCANILQICAITLMLGPSDGLSSPTITSYLSPGTSKLIVLKSLVLSETDGFSCQRNCSFQHFEYLEEVCKGKIRIWSYRKLLSMPLLRSRGLEGLHPEGLCPEGLRSWGNVVFVLVFRQFNMLDAGKQWVSTVGKRCPVSEQM